MASRSGSLALVVLVVAVLIRPASVLICEPSHHASVGDDVTLTCFHRPPPTEEGESVVWTLNPSDNVLVFRNFDFSRDDQADRFSGRASPGDGWAPAKGRYPVTLSSVTEADGGTYRCSVGVKSQKRSCATLLIINQKVEKQAGEKAAGEKAAGEKPAGFGLMVTLMLAAAALGYCLWS